MYPDNIALAIFTDNTSISSNSDFTLSNDTSKCFEQLKDLAENTKAEWLLFWDDSIQLPSVDLLQQLTSTKVDIWHAGLKMGLSGLPDVMIYVDPTWMYNKDAGSEVEHSSFRLSIKACLIRVNVLRMFIHHLEIYSSVEATGLALGYAMFKSGCIMRYHPQLIASEKQPVILSIKDEWTFARQFYTSKWHSWILLNRPEFVNNLNGYLRTSNISYKKLKPVVHRSDTLTTDTLYKTVSILAPTLKRYPYLISELKQLSVQTILPHEVLITDQTDIEERQILPIEDYPNLNIQYYPQEEKGQCLAWNKLLTEATGEYVLFFGDDADHITPDFIEKLLHTAQEFNADMVASNVIEIGTPEQPVHPYYYVSDTFPITLIRKDVLDKTGYMDMFFNKNIRADQDLAMRCHLQGTLMIFNPSATIHHHRAPVGGLRAHKARVVTNFMAKNSITKFVVPTSSELYLVMKYFNTQQFKSFVRIKYFNQLMVNGSIFRKIAKLFVFAFKYPSINKQYRKNLQAAEQALAQLKATTQLHIHESAASN
jgi:glycosyltransferase involved in cell wall biosynthesis